MVRIWYIHRGRENDPSNTLEHSRDYCRVLIVPWHPLPQMTLLVLGSVRSLEVCNARRNAISLDCASPQFRSSVVAFVSSAFAVPCIRCSATEVEAEYLTSVLAEVLVARLAERLALLVPAQLTCSKTSSRTSGISQTALCYRAQVCSISTGPASKYHLHP